MASTATSSVARLAEARVHKLLEVRTDTLAMRDALASVATIKVEGDVTASSLRTALDRASFDTMTDFIARLAPLVSEIDSLASESAAISAGLSRARDRLARSEADTAAFLSSAGDLNSRKADLTAQLGRVTSFLSKFELTSEENEALERGPSLLLSTPAAAATGFFEALERLGEIRASALSLLTTPEQALGLELLDAATRQQSQALDRLFESALPLCREAESLQPSPEEEDDSNAPSTGRALRRALRVLRSTRPAYFNTCSEAVAAARRAALVKAFLRALTGSASTSTGTARPIDASAHDPLRYIGDMLAWTHLAAAEERELLHYLLAQPAVVEVPSGEPESKDGEAAALSAPAALLTTVMDGIAKPLRVRIEQMITSQAMSSSIITLFRVLDLLAFYAARFDGLVQQRSSALVSALRSCSDRCATVFRDACNAMSERIRSSTLALPHDLTPSSLTTGTLTLADDLLKASDKCMHSSDGSAAGGATMPRVADVLTLLLEPLLAACRASAEGLRLVDTSTYMLNNLAVLHGVLSSSSPAAVQWVQRLASEMNSWEESLVQAAANDMLASCGMLTKLAAVKSASEGASSGAIATLPGVGPDDLRPVINAFLASLASPAYVTLYDRVQNVRVRSRVRRDTGAVLAAAYARLYDVVTSPRAGYTQLCDVAALMRQTPAQVALLADVQ